MHACILWEHSVGDWVRGWACARLAGPGRAGLLLPGCLRAQKTKRRDMSETSGHDAGKYVMSVAVRLAS